MTKRIFTNLFAAIIVTAILTFSVFATMCACASETATETTEIEGVYARDIDIEYDGRAHSVSVENTEPDDDVFYRPNESEAWSKIAPEFVMPGEYTVFIRIERVGCNAFETQATVVIRKCVLDGISALPVKYVFDGTEHTVELVGTEDGDAILYSEDGETFADGFSASAVGEYRVYYVVDRGYGEYRGEAVLTILPDLSGEYVNIDNGVIVLGSDTAEIDGNVLSFEYGVDGIGVIAGKECAVADNILTYGGVEYVRKGLDRNIFEIDINGTHKFVVGGESILIEIEFDGKATVKADGATLIEVPNVNYCDSIDLSDYGTTDISLSTDEKFTEIVLVNLEEQDIAPVNKVYEYDGERHGYGIEYDGKVLYLIDGSYSESEPLFITEGRYETTTVYIKDGYLPKVTTSVVEIVERISGVYFDANAVIEVESDRAFINGIEKSKVYENGEWKIDGRAFMLSDGKLVDKSSGREYARQGSAKLVAIEILGVWFVAEFDDCEISVAKDEEGVITVSDRSGRDLAYGRTDGKISVTVNGIAVSGEEGQGFVIGISELNAAVNFVRIGIRESNPVCLSESEDQSSVCA